MFLISWIRSAFRSFTPVAVAAVAAVAAPADVGPGSHVTTTCFRISINSSNFFLLNRSGLRFRGKISRDGILYLDFSAHFRQYNLALLCEVAVAAAVAVTAAGRYINFACFVSWSHVFFGAGSAGTSGASVGSNLKSMTSHLSICRF